MDLSAFAAEVGADGPVTAVGGRTQWDVGGSVDPAAREVKAPGGIEAIRPEEMTVTCGAGTSVADLDAALAEVGQFVALPSDPGATVGGVLAVGRSGVRRLGYGPVRDTLLQARFVSAAGRVVKAGGPTVKNVSGYDLCRLLVGSLGTLGFLGEVILRTKPLPAASRWFTGAVDPAALRRRLHGPVALLWDGTTTWVLLEGHPADVAEQAAGAGLAEADGPPPLPPQRWSIPPAEVRTLTGDFVAEVGVGVVHHRRPAPPREADAPVRELHRRLKQAYDPEGRLNPGRSVLA